MTLRLGIVGLGMAVTPHALSLLELADVISVRWAATRSRSRAEVFAKRYPFPVTCDVEAAICDSDVDAILLLTPANTHQQLACLAFRRGKHVLIEKPLDARRDRAADIVRHARAAGVTLGVVLQHRFRPSALRLHAIQQKGRLGDIAFASVSVPWWRPQAYYDEPGRGTIERDGGGVLLTQALHTIDLFRSLVGPLEVCAAHVRTTALHRMETEDYATAILRLRNGAPATLFATTAHFPGRAERIELVGTRGTAVLEGTALDVHYADGQTERIADAGPTGSGADVMAFSHVAHKALLMDFVGAVRERRSPIASGDEALATQDFIDAVLTHSGRDRQPSLL